MTRITDTSYLLAFFFLIPLLHVAAPNALNYLFVGALDNPVEAMKYFADDFLLLLVGIGMSIFVGWRLDKVIDADIMGIHNKFLMNLWVFILK